MGIGLAVVVLLIVLVVMDAEFEPHDILGPLSLLLNLFLALHYWAERLVAGSGQTRSPDTVAASVGSRLLEQIERGEQPVADDALAAVDPGDRVRPVLIALGIANAQWLLLYRPWHGRARHGARALGRMRRELLEQIDTTPVAR